MAHCTVTLEELTDYAEGRAAPALAERLRAHLETGCPSCQERTAQIAGSITALRDALSPLSAPLPKSARDYARNLSRLRQTDTASAPTPSRPPFLTRIGRLLFDGGQGQMLAAQARRETGDTAGHGTQRLYETDEHLITLWEERGAEGVYVIGQVYDKQEGVDRIPEGMLLTEITTGDTRAARQEPDSGEFHAANLLPGTYRIEFDLDDAEVVLTDVPLGKT